MTTQPVTDWVTHLPIEELLDLLDTDIGSRFGAESLNGGPKHGPDRPQLLTDAQLGQLPALEWDIEGILPTGGHSYLVGIPGSGKTLLALDWSCHVALGRP